MDWVEKLKQRFSGKVVTNKSLSALTTLKMGGEAKAFIEVDTQDLLIDVLRFATDENIPYLVIGGGSNLLINDSGVDVLVIKNSIPLITSRLSIITVSSGTILQDLVNYAVENGLSGIQKLTGIPGTVGGAVYGNAGAYGQTISDHILTITIFDGIDIKTLSKEGCGFDYRTSIFKQIKDTILEVKFELEPADPKILKTEADGILTQRLQKYPAGIKCPGSFFKNVVATTLTTEQLSKIPEDKIVYGKLPAGILLEVVGAKGDSFKGIEIAPYHANLFINQGNGTAEDFYKLAQKYWLKVKEQFGIELEPEVQLIGLPKLA